MKKYKPSFTMMLRCERRSGYFVCYPYRRRRKRILGRALAVLGVAAFFLLIYPAQSRRS
jgi:hypothetical protein